MVFAQQFGPPGGRANDDEFFVMFIVILLGAMCIGLIIGLIIQYFFCLSLSNLLKQIHPRNRHVEPLQAYRLFIPFYSLYWIFALTGRIADSLEDEYRERRWRRDGDFGRTIGMWYGITSIGSIIPYLGSLIAIGAIVLWILYWVKAVAWRRELEKNYDPRRDDYDDDDEHDDRSRRDDDDYDR
jgi:hypothetical protein